MGGALGTIEHNNREDKGEKGKRLKMQQCNQGSFLQDPIYEYRFYEKIKEKH